MQFFNRFFSYVSLSLGSVALVLLQATVMLDLENVSYGGEFLFHSELKLYLLPVLDLWFKFLMGFHFRLPN